MPETSFSTSTGKKRAAETVTYGDVSTTINLEITKGDCKVSIDAATHSTTTGYVTLTYTLEDDRTGMASIQPQYATTRAGSFTDMTKGTGGNNQTGLATDGDGIQYTFIWDTVTDLGGDYEGSVVMKIIAYDRDNFIGDTMESNSMELHVDNAPAAPTITTPADGLFSKDETPQVIGTIPDPMAGYTNLHIKLQFSTDENFNDDNVTTFESRLDQNGWQYDSSGSGDWTDIPVGGIPVSSDHTLVDNSWRFTVQTEDKLNQGLYYIRAYAGGTG